MKTKSNQPTLLVFISLISILAMGALVLFYNNQDRSTHMGDMQETKKLGKANQSGEFQHLAKRTIPQTKKQPTPKLLQPQTY